MQTSSSNPALSLQAIVDQLGGEIVGNTNTIIGRVGSLAFAQEGAIGFFKDAKYSNQLHETKASAVILKLEHSALTPLPQIITDNPYAYFAKVSALLNPVVTPPQSIHQHANINSDVKVPLTVSISANVTIESGVTLGEHVVIGAGCVIERGVHIGNHTVLEPNVTIKHGCVIGDDCHLFSGSVIGSDGFGYAEEVTENQQRHWVKIPQVGRVILHNRVDVGANTTIDRGAIDDTVIEEGVKLDNLIHIAHNCRIGAHTVIAGCTGIAGSAVIGRHCKIGGAAMILGHLTIADEVTISPGSMIMRTISKAGTYTALMPSQMHADWLKTAANIRHLNQLTDKIRHLEDVVAQLLNNHANSDRQE